MCNMRAETGRGLVTTWYAGTAALRAISYKHEASGRQAIVRRHFSGEGFTVDTDAGQVYRNSKTAALALAQRLVREGWSDEH